MYTHRISAALVSAALPLCIVLSGCPTDGHPPPPPIGPSDGGVFDSAMPDAGPGRCEPGATLSRSARPVELRVDEMTMADVSAICEWGRRLGSGDCGMLAKRVMPSCEADILFTGTVTCDVQACEVEQCFMDQLITPASGHCGAEACARWADCGQRAVDAMAP